MAEYIAVVRLVLTIEARNPQQAERMAKDAFLADGPYDAYDPDFELQELHKSERRK